MNKPLIIINSLILMLNSFLPFGIGKIENSFTSNIEKATVYSIPESEKIDNIFKNDDTSRVIKKVIIDDQEADCYGARLSKIPTNCEYTGTKRPLEHTEIGSFVSFDMTDDAEIKINLPEGVDGNDVKIRPTSKEIKATVKNKIVTFTISETGQYSVEIDGRNNILTIFANAPETPNKAATYYYAPGVYDIGRLHLKDNESVYIEAGAVVYGEIDATDAKNISISGRGILNGSKVERVTSYWGDIREHGLIHFTRCENVNMDGVILFDSVLFTVSSINCFNMHFDNVKVIGNWRYNSDGFDFINSQNVHVSNCYLRVFDDVIVVKGIAFSEPNGDRIVEKTDNLNYLIENCVVWCDWGGALEIGAETVADKYDNIIYRNCDIIRTDQGALRITAGDRANISNVKYENINVEYSKYDEESKYQTPDEEYVKKDVPSHNYTIKIWIYDGNWSPDDLFGRVSDVSYSNINVIIDKEVPTPENLFSGFDEEHSINNITIENFMINGKEVAPNINKNDFVYNLKAKEPTIFEKIVSFFAELYNKIVSFFSEIFAK